MNELTTAQVAELREAAEYNQNQGFRFITTPETIIALLDGYEALKAECERLEEVISADDNAFIAYTWRRHAAELEKALGDATKAENSNARRMREAIVEARRHLAKGRALWNGPCIQCDGVLEQALRADNDLTTAQVAEYKADPLLTKWAGWKVRALAAEATLRMARTCGGNDPANCGWPTCGCDPHAIKVIEALSKIGALRHGENGPERVMEETLTAQSIATMITKWVEGGIRYGTDWRPHLPAIIERRLHRLRMDDEFAKHLQRLAIEPTSQTFAHPDDILRAPDEDAE